MPNFHVRRRDAQVEADQQRDEAYRLLRTNVEVALADLDRPTVLVTSANTGEGKTQTTTELARSFALAGRRVVAVDLDLRNPTMHLAFGEPEAPGVSDLLREQCVLADAIRYLTTDGPAGPSGLYVLPAGSQIANPSELISTHRTARLLDTLSKQADIILIDSPPVLPVADTLVLARMVAGVLLVVNSGSTSYAAAIRAKDSLVRNHARILGMVLNRFATRSGDFQFGYGGSYESDRETAGNGRPGLDRDESAWGNGLAP
jgi:capsular exopolysaccharide synthesis family protein